MDNKLYDMSANIVKLNLDAAIKVAGEAVQNARSAMGHAQGEIDNAYLGIDRNSTESLYHASHHCQFYAGVLAEAAEAYKGAWELYHALSEAKRRLSNHKQRCEYTQAQTARRYHRETRRR